MEAKSIDKISGYFVGFGELNSSQKSQIEKLNLPDGTYRIKGISGYVGIGTDNEGKTGTEKSRGFADFPVAYKGGKSRKELAIGDCKNGRNIWLIEQKDKKAIFHVKYKQFEYGIYEE